MGFLVHNILNMCIKTVRSFFGTEASSNSISSCKTSSSSPLNGSEVEAEVVVADGCWLPIRKSANSYPCWFVSNSTLRYTIYNVTAIPLSLENISGRSAMSNKSIRIFGCSISLNISSSYLGVNLLLFFFTSSTIESMSKSSIAEKPCLWKIWSKSGYVSSEWE